MVYVSVFLLFISLAVIQFSFSDLFGEYIWVSIGCLKFMAIVIEELILGAMDEDLLASPLAMVLNVCFGLVTMGADDFLDFLNGFFIELGIMIFERTYFGEIVGFFVDMAGEIGPWIVQAIQYWFFTEDDGLDDEEEFDMTPSVSEIYYSEEESVIQIADLELND